jgi:two-component system chemotaxis sensor kinase CheA
MDDLLREFLTETTESLDVVDLELVKFEQDPNNDKILGNIFRLVHTIKGTCGFLGLPRLEAIAHAAETLMGKFRDGAPVTTEAVSLVLRSIDRIKAIVGELERLETEPEGEDRDVIAELERMAETADQAQPAPAEARPEPALAQTAGSLVYQVLDRPLRPGEVSLDELERAFRETSVEVKPAAAAPPSPPKAAPPKAAPAKAVETAEKPEGAADESAVKNQSIRVNVDTLEHLMTMVSELVLTRNQLLEIARRNEDNEFKVPLQRLSNVTAELQEGVMKTRMQPIGNAWQKLPRIVRDLAKELGKSIDLDMHGADTELDRQVLELIKDPLTHMVRNSADHGLERPADRLAVGKPETGTIKLSAYHQGGHIIIEIADDGRGLDVNRIRRKAVDNGLVSEADADKLSEAQIHKFIFAAGFSTAAAVTNVSGRGVGMDVVKTNIDAIGGTVDLRSVAGQGTTFTIKIPLTLAIVSALIVEAAGDRFAIPQLAVVELVRASTEAEHRIERIKDTPVLRLRNKLLPLVHLSRLLGTATDETKEDSGFVVVSQIGARIFGIVVDGVFHTEEIVVKPMSSKLRHIDMFSGNTILGDGSVIMIIDPNGIAAMFGGAGDEEAESTAAESRGEGDARTAFLVFRAGGENPKAVPLSLVTRLEEIDAAKIEQANGRDLVQYRGALMPLVYVNNQVRRGDGGTQQMLVFSDGGRSMGLVVDQIVDIVEDRLSIEIASNEPGVIGTAVVKGKATEIVDVGYYLPLAFDDWFKRQDRGAHAVSKRLLFVDDSAFFRDMLTPVLRAAGYEVQAFASAHDALATAKKGGAYDVIVSDIDMPGMSGFEFAEACRAEEGLRHVPIIALAGASTGHELERGRSAGFHDFVAKFDRQGLIAALKETAAMGVAA